MGLRTKTLIVLSGLILSAAAARWAGPTAAFVVIFGHVLVYQTHVLEVKINKLLNDRGLHVSQQEIDE